MVIGTPSLWDKNILKKVNYDPNIGACDDTDICYRLGKKGYSFVFLLQCALPSIEKHG